jgi:hypothetical protein
MPDSLFPFAMSTPYPFPVLSSPRREVADLALRVRIALLKHAPLSTRTTPVSGIESHESATPIATAQVAVEQQVIEARRALMFIAVGLDNIDNTLEAMERFFADHPIAAAWRFCADVKQLAPSLGELLSDPQRFAAKTIDDSAFARDVNCVLRSLASMPVSDVCASCSARHTPRANA